MLLTSRGKITEDFYVVGDPGVPVYLMDGDEPVPENTRGHKITAI